MRVRVVAGGVSLGRKGRCVKGKGTGFTKLKDPRSDKVQQGILVGQTISNLISRMEIDARVPVRILPDWVIELGKGWDEVTIEVSGDTSLI